MTWKRKPGVGRATMKATAVQFKREFISKYRKIQQNADPETHRIRLVREVRASEERVDRLARQITWKNPQPMASELRRLILPHQLTRKAPQVRV